MAQDTRIWDEATRLQQQHDEVLLRSCRAAGLQDVKNHRDLINGCHKRTGPCESLILLPKWIIEAEHRLFRTAF